MLVKDTWKYTDIANQRKNFSQVFLCLKEFNLFLMMEI